MNYNELRKKAGELGIKTHGKKTEELERLIAEASEVGVLSAPTEALSPQQQEAKSARMSGRKRRGGSILGKGEMKLNRPEYKRKGFASRFFTNEPGRLQAAYDNDWDYVLKDGEKVVVRSGTNKDGSLRNMHLMEKRDEWYKEDQFKKREQDRRNEKLLRSGQASGGGGGMNQAQAQWSDDAAKAETEAGVPVVSLGDMPTYVPTGGIQINSIIKQ